MWYFAWILGTAFACSFAVFNAMWIEFSEDELKDNY
jgi:cytochrome bd-I ubiquinol oxidase subunit X